MADAIIALTSNIAMRQKRRIEFDPEGLSRRLLPLPGPGRGEHDFRRQGWPARASPHHGVNNSSGRISSTGDSSGRRRYRHR